MFSIPCTRHEKCVMLSHMSVLYVANIRFPTEKAHGKQVREMCNALSEHTKVTLLVPTRKTTGTPQEFGLSEQVRVVRILVPDLVRFGRIGFLITSFFFAIGSAVYAFLHLQERVITREYMCAVLPALFGMKVAWESHRGEWNWLIKLSVSFGTRIITISEGLRTFYVSKGVRKEKILVAPDAADLSRYKNLPSRKDAREKLSLPQQKRIVIYNGHLHTWKGAGTLAQAAAFLPDDFLVLFMGGTDEDIHAFTKEYGADTRIRILGRKEDAERPLYLRAADVVVLPNTAKDIISSNYTSPLKLFGYMAAGSPIVSSDLPSIREIISEKTAFFAKPDDPRSFADTILRAIQSPEDAQIRANAARAEVEKFSWEKRCAHILSFLG